MNEEKMAYEQLKNGISKYVNSYLANVPFPKIETAIILGKTDDGYTIKLNGKNYYKILALFGKEYSKNQTVVVCVPNGNYNNMFILGNLQ